MCFPVDLFCFYTQDKLPETFEFAFSLSLTDRQVTFPVRHFLHVTLHKGYGDNVIIGMNIVSNV